MFVRPSACITQPTFYDGTAAAAAAGCPKNMNVAVAGVPKTIDNDVDIIDRSFGFLTSVEVHCSSSSHRFVTMAKLYI